MGGGEITPLGWGEVIKNVQQSLTFLVTGPFYCLKNYCKPQRACFFFVIISIDIYIRN